MPPEGRRAICIAVDDFGLHAGINRAALQLAAMGRVHAIGCMVGGPAWAAAGRALRQLEPDQVDLGLHLDLTETPLSPGAPRSLAALVGDSFLGRIDRRAVRAQVRAQLDAFEQAIGRGPAYVDGHRHVHQLPTVRSELLAEVGARYGAFRPWLRSTRRPQGPAWRSPVKPWVIEQLGARGLASAARGLGYPQNRHLLGVYDFQGGAARYAALLAAWLHAAGHADLLMCHPSRAAHAADPLIDARNAEFQVLSGADFDTLRADAGVELQPMSRILQAAARVPAAPQADEVNRRHGQS